jgi:glycerol-3-phosphate dehydrogenase
VDGRPLSAIINEKHENVKYLPDVQLGTNVRAEPDLVKAVEGATAFIIVLPHQVRFVVLCTVVNCSTNVGLAGLVVCGEGARGCEGTYFAAGSRRVFD